MSIPFLKRLALVFAVQLVCVSALLLLDFLPQSSFWRFVGIACIVASFVIPCVSYIYTLKTASFMTASSPVLRVFVIGFFSFFLTGVGLIAVVMLFVTLGFPFLPHE
jgi:hypothetical protein